MILKRKKRKGRLRYITDLTIHNLRDADIIDKDAVSGKLETKKIGFQKIPEEIKTEKKKVVKGKHIKSRINCGQNNLIPQGENVDIKKPIEENDSQVSPE